MATFQDARDGLDALILEKGARLTPAQKDQYIQEAAKRFSRRLPLIKVAEIIGDGGFDYDLPADFELGFSTITPPVYFPWNPDFQHPDELEPKDWEIFLKPTGKVFRMLTFTIPINQKALIRFTARHNASPVAITDTVEILSGAGTSVATTLFSAAVDVESAKGLRAFVRVASGAGELEVELQSSEDGLSFAPIGIFEPFTAAGDQVELLEKAKVSKKFRLKYTVISGGPFVLEATLERETSTPSFTIPDAVLDAFNLFSAHITARALQSFYAGLSSGTIAGDTSDYEGKSSFWKTNADDWMIDFKREMEQIPKDEETGTPFGSADWDIHFSDGHRMLSHHPRLR